MFYAVFLNIDLFNTTASGTATLRQKAVSFSSALAVGEHGVERRMLPTYPCSAANLSWFWFSINSYIFKLSTLPKMKYIYVLTLHFHEKPPFMV